MGVVVGGGVLHDNNNDDTYMTPLGRFDEQSRSAQKAQEIGMTSHLAEMGRKCLAEQKQIPVKMCKPTVVLFC